VTYTFISSVASHSDDSEFVVSNQSDINITGRAGMRATAAYGLSSPEESHP
jgi:hypothetical protein